MDDRDDALVVGGDDEILLPVSVDVALLDVPQPVELPPELRIPVRLLRPASIRVPPHLQHRLIRPDRENPPFVRQRFMEGVAVRILQDRRLPPVLRLPHDQQLREPRHRPLRPIRLHDVIELRLRHEQRRIRSAPKRVANRRPRRRRASAASRRRCSSLRRHSGNGASLHDPQVRPRGRRPRRPRGILRSTTSRRRDKKNDAQERGAATEQAAEKGAAARRSGAGGGGIAGAMPHNPGARATQQMRPYRRPAER